MRHVSKHRTLTFKTQTLAALRAVVGDECKMKETRSRDEPADQNPRVVDMSTLVIKCILRVYLCNGPWPIVGCCRGGGKSKQPQTRPTSEFWIFRQVCLQYGLVAGWQGQQARPQQEQASGGFPDPMGIRVYLAN